VFWPGPVESLALAFDPFVQESGARGDLFV
jgi:hypothetical protein